MAEQTLLPFAPPYLATLGRPEPDSTAARNKMEVEYHNLRVRKILNRCLNPRLPFSWTVNPYRGCEFGCTYCYARYTHHFFELTRWQDFEQRIFIKRQAADALERQLRRHDFRGQPIAIGTATDPYQPAERHFEITRSLLETFASVEGLEVSIATKSPLILRDLEILRRLDRLHSLTVQVTLTTLDSGLARRLEPRAPDPQARLRAIRRLSSAGIDTSVLCMPLMPGINDDERQLAPLLAAARDAGAFDVIGSALFLRPAARARFFPWLRREFPALEDRYRDLYRRRDYLSTRQRDRLFATFRHLRLLNGFPRSGVAKG